MAATFDPRPHPVTGDPAQLIESLGAHMAARYGDAERQMIGRVAGFTRQGLDVPPSVAERQRILTQLRAEGERVAAELTDPAYARRVVDIAAAEGRAAAAASLGASAPAAAAVASGMTTTQAAAVASVAVDLASNLTDMRARITRWMPDAYRHVIGITSASVLTGVETLRASERRAAERFLGRGITGFVAQDGRPWRIGTYAEMSTRTLVNRAWQEANIAQAQSHGIGLCSIVIGISACTDCAAHAGRVWSTDGRPAGVYTMPNPAGGAPVQVTVAGPLEQARAGGWNHPNCRCVVVPYQAGGTIQSASVHSPQAERDRDRLRELERRVRDLKRREAGALDDVSRARLQGRIRAAQADIRTHVSDTGITRRRYREQLDFSDGPRIPAYRPMALTP